jgi:cytochrome b6
MGKATPFLGMNGPFSDVPRIGSVPLVTTKSDAAYLLLAGTSVGENALMRFYVLHCIALPLAAAVLIAIHFWRIRKDGGISGPM